VDDGRLQAALAAIDAVNATDDRVLMVRGEAKPKALGEGELASAWLAALRPGAPVALQLAVRGHHLRRWAIARTALPEGRRGYLRWRQQLKAVHAETAAEILAPLGWDADTIARVQQLVRKEGLGRDPDTQTLEDVICLVFLETQLLDLAAKLDEDHMVSVLQKTLPKMSEEGRRVALSLELPAAAAALVGRALEEPS